MRKNSQLKKIIYPASLLIADLFVYILLARLFVKYDAQDTDSKKAFAGGTAMHYNEGVIFCCCIMWNLVNVIVAWYVLKKMFMTNASRSDAKKAGAEMNARFSKK